MNITMYKGSGDNFCEPIQTGEVVVSLFVILVLFIIGVCGMISRKGNKHD